MLFRTAFASCVLSLLSALGVQARTVDITMGKPRSAAVSGVEGLDTTELFAAGHLFRIEFGQRMNQPCFVKAHFLIFEDDTHDTVQTATFDRCGGRARRIQTIETDAGDSGYTGIDQLSVCNTGLATRHLKGATIRGTATFLRDLDDDIVNADADIAFQRSGCTLTSVPSACDPGMLATGLKVSHNGSVVVGLGLTCSRVTAEPHKVRSGDFTHYPIDFSGRHWAALEGVHPLLRVRAGQEIETRICAEDFPPGSPAEAMVLRALSQVESVQNTAIRFEPRTEACIDDERQIFAAAALDVDVQIQLVDWGCPRTPGDPFGAFSATGGVCYLNTDEAEPWRVGDCNGWADCYADAAVVMLRTSNFPNATRIPSVGVIVHELGHMFGQLHNYDDAANACSGLVASHNYRKPKLFHLLPGFAKGHGTGRNFEAPGFGAANADMRAQSPTAYSVAYMRYHYPRLPQAVLWPSVKEWAIHQTVTDRDRGCNLPTAVTGTKPVTFFSEKSVYDIVPQRLCPSVTGPVLLDCATDATPVFRVQFSSNDTGNCTGQAASLTVVADGEVVYEQPIPLPAGCKLAYYNWSAAVDIPAAGLDEPRLTARRIDIVVNRGTRLDELDPDNNSVSFDIPVVRR